MTHSNKNQTPPVRNVTQMTALLAFASVVSILPQVGVARETHALKVDIQPQIVTIDDRFALFEAEFLIGSVGQADGVMTLIFANGDTCEFKMIYSIQETLEDVQQGKPLLIIAEDVEHRTCGLLLMVTPRINPDDSDVDGDDFLVWQRGSSRETEYTPPKDNGCIIWDLIGSQVLSDSTQVMTEATFAQVAHDFPHSEINDADLDYWRATYGKVLEAWKAGDWPLKIEVR